MEISINEGLRVSQEQVAAIREAGEVLERAFGRKMFFATVTNVYGEPAQIRGIIFKLDIKGLRRHDDF